MKTIKKNVKINLFYKFVFGITSIIIIFGIINLIFLWKAVYSSFEKEIDKRCVVLAKLTADKAITPILYEDIVSLYETIDEIKKSDDNIIYIFILDKNGKIILGNYNFKPPQKLISANKVKTADYNIQTISAKNFEYETIRDIAYPIMNGKLGTVRIGLAENDIQKDLKKTSFWLILMILGFLIIGTAGAMFFSFVITSPIKKISKIAESFDFKNKEKIALKKSNQKAKKIGSIYFHDELDDLEHRFIEMAERLQTNYEELQKTQKSIINTEKLASIGTLTAGLAHEINNPISGINNCLNRIKKNPQNIEQNKRYFELITDATHKIEKTVQELLNFSKKQKPSISKVCVQEIIDDIISLSEQKILKNNIKITINIEPNHTLQASKNHLEQVILNLILNSIDAINSKQKTQLEFRGEITIVSKKINDQHHITITDNGIGLPKKDKNQIFDPFFTTKEVGKGTGLGLYVSHEIIRRHDGTLIASTNSENNTEFEIILPQN